MDSSEERKVRSDFQIQSIDVWEDGVGSRLLQESREVGGESSEPEFVAWIWT
jgi:hypothetical protein